MKLTDLLERQRVIVQILWGEQKIEFASEVIGHNDSELYIKPYYMNGEALELDITNNQQVICNLYADDITKQIRISWKNIGLTTVQREDGIVYSLSTSAFNSESKNDDRRDNERTIIHSEAKLFVGESTEGIDIIVHDISNVGISFYVQGKFVSKSQRLTVLISDVVNDKQFDLKIDCTVSRIVAKDGNTFVGCRVGENNKLFMLYVIAKRYAKKLKMKESEE